MEIPWIKQKEHALLLIVIIIFALFGFWLRLLPTEILTGGTVQKVIFMDSWFSLRQIEMIVANNLSYPWFEHMTGYPYGKIVDWGPVYPLFSAFISILLGATTRQEIVSVASWIPPVLSFVMVPIMYYAGKCIKDWKTGIISAILISIISGEYLYRSFFGYLDHHQLEVILTTLFMVLYISAIRISAATPHISPWHNKNLIALSVFSGLVYYLGIMNMPTSAIFAGIIGIFCFIHALITLHKTSLQGISIIHFLSFTPFIILFGFTGVHHDGMGLDQYTPLHLLIALSLILEPILLAGVIHILKGRANWEIRSTFTGIPIVLYALVSVVFPDIITKFNKSLWFFFVYSYQNTFINEIQMWDLTRALHSFNIALILMSIGIIAAFYQIIKRYEPTLICAIIWGFIIIAMTVLHVRFEYYAAVIVVLFSAYALSLLYTKIQTCVSSGGSQKICGKNAKENNKGTYISTIIIGIIIISITILSSQVTYVVATEKLSEISINDDWMEALLWLNQNSADPGVDFLKIYQKDEFEYPSSAYGVLSWWDYGHWIMYVAKRIPISSPFQNNVALVAKFFIATNEEDAEKFARNVSAKYIITDYRLTTTTFAAIPLWATGAASQGLYQKTYYQSSPNAPEMYQPVITLRDNFFKAMVTRLQIFDGTQVNPRGTHAITYKNTAINSKTYPIITNIRQISPGETQELILRGLTENTDIVSIQYTSPITKTPALRHYRLVYESPTIIATDDFSKIHNVKIFERVTGHHIPGNGTIEIPLISNQGRKFTYQQDSINGEFIVPYSTIRDGNGTKAAGPYQNLQTGEKFEVTEEQVSRGA